MTDVCLQNAVFKECRRFMNKRVVSVRLLRAGGWRCVGAQWACAVRVRSGRPDVDSPAAELELWPLLLSRFLKSPHFARIFLPLHGVCSHPQSIHGNRKARRNQHRFIYFFHSFVCLQLVVTVYVSFCFRRFPDSFIDKDPKKAVEVNISVSQS